jgi:hypothetical protein
MNHGLPFDRHRYISLETTKRDGTAVRTPVWFATDPGKRAYFMFTPRRMP